MKETLADAYPDIAKEWHPTKNGDLTPQDVCKSTNLKVWWLCPNGHEYQTRIGSRTSKNKTGCPYCGRHMLIRGENDLQTVRPEIAAEWNAEKNGDLTPSDITKSSSKKVWWTCPEGHDYQASPNCRTSHGCPYCTGKKVLQGYNDLETKRPDLIKEWDFEKNTSLSPSRITVGSHRKVWWKCNLGHSYLSRINSRTAPQQSGCPVCAKLLVKNKKNSLQARFPEIAKEWDIEKNLPLDPSFISAHSTKPVWWVCRNGHHYQKSVQVRTAGYGCPFCSGRKAIPGETDLPTLCPEIAEEWNYEKNQDLLPSMVKYKSRKKVWWRCPEGHEYEATVKNRTKGSGCPYCSGRKAIPGETDLKTRFPEIAEEWDMLKNEELSPETITSGSRKIVWWKCSKGHEWKDSVFNRTCKNNHCPVCKTEHSAAEKDHHD